MTNEKIIEQNKQSKFNHMKTKNLFVVGLLLGSAFMAQRASAQFVLMDNLTAQPTGNLDGLTAADGGTWTSVGVPDSITIGPSATTGNAALAGGTDGADYLALPATIGGGSTAATVFFQFDMGSSQTANNVNWSLENPGTATDSAGNSGSAAAAVEVNANAPGRAGLTVRNGGAFDEMSANGSTTFTPANSTKYDMWMVLDQSAKTYQIYMSGGALGSTPTLMSIGTGTYNANPTAWTTTGAYRSGSATPSDFIFGPGGTPNSGNSQGLYDVYEDPGSADLLDPTAVSVVPEPGTLALLGFGGSALLLQLRRHRKS